MARTIEREIKRALWEAYPPPKRIEWLINAATYDLYYGPTPAGADIDGHEYPGFTSALDEIENWFDENVPSEVWFDSDSGEVLESEPEAFEEDGEIIEPFWEEIYHVDRVRKEMLGKLAEYL